MSIELLHFAAPPASDDGRCFDGDTVESVVVHPLHDALLDLLAGGGEPAELLCLECARGLVGARELARALREALTERGHGFAVREVEAAVRDLVVELAPRSPAAVRVRLRERVRADVVTRADGGGVLIAGEVIASRAVEIALAYEDRFWREVVEAVARGHGALHAVARRLRTALAGIGRDFSEDEVRDELLIVARDLFPEADLEPTVDLTAEERKDLDAILEFESVFGEFDFSQAAAKALFFWRRPSSGEPSNRGPFPEECERLAAYLGRRTPDGKAARDARRKNEKEG